MSQKAKKKSKASLTKGQSRLLKDSLKKLLGPGLLETPQRPQHEIHPYLLRDAISTRILTN